MATMVLTVAGGLIGGPIGAAIGGTIGNVVDRELLFRPRGREGPRLSELRVQTSSYGTQIPKLFGTMRVAGSVIWAADLVEHRSASGGKGRPGATEYSYTASFAVALSARPILGVGRIWAEGRLLRGAAGDFKVRTGFRLHSGDEDQPPDPLIAAAEGSAQAPAHRGIAYAVFEDLELGDFGNRIPSLTFEVFADSEPPAAGAIAAAIAVELAAEDATVALTGFSAHGDSVRAVAETLAGAAGAWFAPGEGAIALRTGAGAARTLADAGAGTGREARGSRAISAAEAAPRTLSLSHYDPARDYQTGVQRALRPGGGSRAAQVELPAAVSAETARTLAETMLLRRDLERERRTVAPGWSAIDVAPGARVRIVGAPGLWRVDRWNLEAMTVTLECVPIAPAALPAEASSGRVLGAPDLLIGETRVHAWELPPLDDSAASAPRLAVAAAGAGRGWRRAALLLSTDGARWTDAGGTAAPATLGSIVDPPGPASPRIEDRINSLDVELAHDAMLLAGADAEALDAGANLAMAGDELLQFASAVPLGGTRWRLAGLWRGRRRPGRRLGDGDWRLGPAALARPPGGRIASRRHDPGPLGAPQPDGLALDRRRRCAARRGARALPCHDRTGRERRSNRRDRCARARAERGGAGGSAPTIRAPDRFAGGIPGRNAGFAPHGRKLMTDSTPRLALPLLAAGQAQKEMSHNEALARLDLLAQSVAVQGGNAPPENPEPGSCWIVGDAAEGAWAGHARSLAGWTEGGWRFVEPFEGLRLWAGPGAGFALFSEGAWHIGEARGRLFVDGVQVVGPRTSAIMEPTGGTVVDAQARAAISAALEALRVHGLIESDGL